MDCIFYPIDLIDDCDDPCLAAAVGGHIVPEFLVIEKICQDADNVNIVYAEVTLNGVFDYIPSMQVLYIDQHNQESVAEISQRFIFDYKRADESPSTFPIKTDCKTVRLLLAWDIGQQIQNFNTLPEMTFRLSMNGQFDTNVFRPGILAEIEDIFVSTNPVAEYLFLKGPSAVPYALFYDEDTGELKLQYSGLGSIPCVCDINCGSLSIDGQTLEICDDEIQEVSVTSNSLVGNPVDVDLTFLDALGNITDLSAHLVHNVTPQAPSAWYMEDFGGTVQIVPFFVSSLGVKINGNKTTFQIWKYSSVEDNLELLQDWSTKRWTTLFDKNVKNGKTYGYAMRFRGEFGEVSAMSSWSTVTVL
jgi:hypothetical protein